MGALAPAPEVEIEATWQLWLRCMVPELYDSADLQLAPLSPLERRTLYCSLSGHFADTAAVAGFLEISQTTVTTAMGKGRSKIAGASHAAH